MTAELIVLIVAAISIGFFHTLFGPDHYLPFIAMAKSGSWSLRKTALITFFCGLGHVTGSVVLGSVGVAFGIVATRIEAIESFRNSLAAWALIAFGLVYFTWGVQKAVRNKPHKHVHPHSNGIAHNHIHSHNEGHIHAHVEKQNKSMTPWILFTIFLFGPCEPLIPLLMYPAARGSFWNIAIVTMSFGIITIATMMGIVLVSAFGISFIPITKFKRYTHAMAGATVLLSGVSIQFLGL